MLFTRLLEVYNVDSDTPLHRITFDSIQTGFDFLKSNCIVVTDEKARLTLLTNIEDPAPIQMKIIETDLIKIRAVEAHLGATESEFFCTVSKEGVQFWST